MIGEETFGGLTFQLTGGSLPLTYYQIQKRLCISTEPFFEYGR
ncbi:hypothetical protein ATG66_3199 [Vibrio sp. ES.051]|nr:hypothetical protein ATG66_3199 [Vibrio sp. ES.051]